MFGSEIIFTYQIAFVLSCSLLIAQSYLAGFALSNEKTFMESKNFTLFLLYFYYICVHFFNKKCISY